MISSSSFWPRWDDQPLFTVLLALFLAAGVLLASAFACKIFRESRHAGYAEQASPSISVTAEGEAVLKNDVATVDVGVTKNASSATQAQDMATTSMNALTAALQTLGISSDDLQTSSYTVYPQYDYDASPAVIVGYEANQTLTVKIRESELVNSVLGKASELGVTNISGLRFEAEDDTEALQEAREEAIVKARAQAEATAEAMGVELGEIVSYSESYGGGVYPMMYRSEGDMMSESVLALPDVQMGQNEVELTVYVSYSLE
jgi:uncharacterized protein